MHRNDSNPAPGTKAGYALWAVVVIWVVLAASGMGWLATYEHTPGDAAQPPTRWPVSK